MREIRAKERERERERESIVMGLIYRAVMHKQDPHIHAANDHPGDDLPATMREEIIPNTVKTAVLFWGTGRMTDSSILEKEIYTRKFNWGWERERERESSATYMLACPWAPCFLGIGKKTVCKRGNLPHKAILGMAWNVPYATQGKSLA